MSLGENESSGRPPATRKTMHLDVVIPTYNEAASLPVLVRRLLELRVDLPPSVDLRILVVDDASPDGTGSVADRLAADHPDRVRVLHRPARRGLGHAYLAGFARVLNHGADLVGQMDADFSHDPEVLPTMLATLCSKNADAVIGSRYLEGASLDPHWAPHRKFLSHAANRFVVPAVIKLPLTDPTSGYRLWKRAALETIDPGRRVRAVGYGFQVEMAFLATSLGLRVAEVPIHFRERKHGRSKMTWNVKLRAIYEILAIRLRHRSGRNQ